VWLVVVAVSVKEGRKNEHGNKPFNQNAVLGIQHDHVVSEFQRTWNKSSAQQAPQILSDPFFG